MGAGLRSLSFGIAHQFHEFKEMGISKQTTAKAMREYADGAQRLRDFVSSDTGEPQLLAGNSIECVCGGVWVGGLVVLMYLVGCVCGWMGGCLGVYLL